jgi:hypothetical protein
MMVHEIKGMTVLAKENDDVSVVVRIGDPVDEEPCNDQNVWAGVILITTKTGKLRTVARLKTGVESPVNVIKFKLG